MRLQLIQKDEYGQTSIMSTGSDVEALVKEAKKLVTEENMNNALALDEKKREYETFFPELLDADGNVTPDLVYGGTVGMGKHVVYAVSTGEKKVVDSISAKVFIGTDNGRDYYAEKVVPGRPGQANPITNLDSQDLREKTVYYFKML